MKPKVVLADDHTIVTEGLKALLEPEFEIVATVANGRAAIKAVRDFNPAVIVLDISMPQLNGIDTALFEPGNGRALYAGVQVRW